MVNNINISNLQMFDKEGCFLPCANGLQKDIQEDIAKKVVKLLNTQEFIHTFIPDYNPDEETKLRIHLTKDGITIEVLERDIATPYTKKDPDLSDVVKTRKEKIIKRVNSLFKEPSFSDTDSLGSAKVQPLFVPSQPKEVRFDANISSPQTQQLHARIKDLENQLNKKDTASSEEIQVIKEQLRFLTQAIHNLSTNTQSTKYPHTEEYALINKLVDNQQNIYRELLNLLSRNLAPNTPPLIPPTQDVENSALREMISKLQQEKAHLEQSHDLTTQSHEETSQLLAQKEQEIRDLQKHLGVLSNLPLQLSNLEQEKTALELKQRTLIDQLDKAKKTQTASSTAFENETKHLERINKDLQEELSFKDEQISGLAAQIQNLPKSKDLQELQHQLSNLQQEKTTLEESHDLTTQSHIDTLQRLAQKEQEIVTLQENLKVLPFLQSQLSNLQQEKDALELEHGNLTEQLKLTNQDQIKLSTTLENETKKLKNATADLQAQISTKDEQIAKLNAQIQSLPKSEDFQELQHQLSNLRQEKAHLEQSHNLSNKTHIDTVQHLAQKEQEIAILQEKLEVLPHLQAQLSDLEQEKIELQSEQRTLTDQINKASEMQAQLITDYDGKIEQLENAATVLQKQLSAKDETIQELNIQIQRSFEAYQELQNQLKEEKEVSTILETAEVLPINNKIASIDTTIENAKTKMELELSSLDESHTPEGLLTPTSGYYTITTPQQESPASSLQNEEITTLQETIETLQEELEYTRPLAYGTNIQIQIIEKMEKSTKTLELELSKKTTIIEDLEKTVADLESHLDKSKSQLKALQRMRHDSEEQQKEINSSLEDNNYLQEELDKIHGQLSLEKKQRAELEQTHEDRLEKLKDLYDKAVLKRTEIIHAKIIDLQQEQKNICFTLVQALAEHVDSGSITRDTGQNIVDLIEKAFNTDGYKTLLNLVSSEEEDLGSLESDSSDGYEEDSYIEEPLSWN